MNKKALSTQNIPSDSRSVIVDKLAIGASIAVFILAFLSYANTLSHGFVLDDPLAIELNKNVTAGFSGIKDIFVGGYRENSFGGHLYRPVSLAMFAIEWGLSPNNPWIHHFMNVLGFALSCVLIFTLLKRWTGSVVFALASALIFAVHPIHTEVVANIKSRDEIMSLFFLLASWISWDNYYKSKNSIRLIVAVLLYFLAILSKETAITMFPIFGLLSFIVYKDTAMESFKKGLLFLLPVLIILAIRYSLFGHLPPIETHVMDNPVVAADGVLQKWATSMAILFQYVQIMVWPHPLSSDYSYLVLPLGKWTDIKVLLGLILHLIAFIWALKNLKNRSFISLCLLAYLMSISLFSQIFITIGTMFGERLAYLGSFWFISFVAYALSKSELSVLDFVQKKPLPTAGLALILGVFVFLTIQRNPAWKDNLTLFTTDAATYPTSVRLNNGCAEEWIKKANRSTNEQEITACLEEAEKYVNTSMAVKPVPTAYLSLGNIRLKQARYEEALKYYDQVNDLKAIVDANKAIAFREMGRIAGEKEQNISKSQMMLQSSLELNDKDAETWFLLGVSHGVSGQHLEAAQKFEKAFEINPIKSYAQNIIMAYQNVGDMKKVQEYTTILGQLKE